MKKIISVVIFIVALSCYKKDDNGYGNNNPPAGGDCGSYNGYQLYKDNQGCYYTGANYTKVYVDASNCKCQ